MYSVSSPILISKLDSNFLFMQSYFISCHVMLCFAKHLKNGKENGAKQ